MKILYCVILMLGVIGLFYTGHCAIMRDAKRIHQQYDVLVYSGGILVEQYVSEKYPYQSGVAVIYNKSNEPVTYVHGETIIVKSREQQ